MATSSGKRGRPKKEQDQKVVKMLIFKLNEEEHKRFLEHFKNSGLRTKKDFFLKSIANSQTVKNVASDRDSMLKDLAKYKSDFGHIGANINQVAHIVNTAGYAADNTQIANSLKEMTDFLQLIDKKSEQILNLMYNFAQK